MSVAMLVDGHPASGAVVAAVHPDGPTSPVFLHSMWRTGSSYLLSKFTLPEYLPFYEPFNGELSSARLRRQAADEYEARRRALRHPSVGQSYFATYDRIDHATGKPLWAFSRPRLPLFDVYNGLSRAGHDLLAACIRVANAGSKTPVFGFCHSGIQIGAMRQRFGGRHIYLSRAPRSQFASYAPQSNDFFIAATAMQLLSSSALRDTAIALAPSLGRYANPVISEFVRVAPHRYAMMLGRAIWRTLNPSEMYALFFLTWTVSNETARRTCDVLLTLEDLAAERLRSQIEADFHIRLDDLRADKPPAMPFDIDFAAIEQHVLDLHRPIVIDGRAPAPDSETSLVNR